MKPNQKIFTIALLVAFTFSSTIYAADTPITIHQIAAKVKSQNVTVLEEMERVYQTKEAIKVARGNLLPKLNLWRIISAVASFPIGLVGLLEDLVPFVIPNNWLRLKEQSLFYQAELLAAQALKANQVFNSKSLYFETLSDVELRALVSECLSSTKSVLEYVKVQQQFGQAPNGASELLTIRVLALEDDLKSLDQLLYTERQALSQLAGLPSKDLLQLVPVTEPFPNISLDVAAIEKVAVELAPELKQFDFLMSASQYVRREAYFSIMGVSSMSRGTAGGVFDSFPIQDGLGFGMGASIRIGRSYTRMIGIQKDGAQQTLSRQVQAMVTSFNLDLDRKINANQRLDQAQRLYWLHQERLKVGQYVPPLELIEALQQMLNAKTDALMVETRLKQTLEKVDRITFGSVDYQE